MHGVDYAHYLGIDISSDAIRRAQALGAARAEFSVGNFDEKMPDGPFDVVIYNESLYYAKRPAEALDRTRRSLAPGGLVLVSMWRTWKNNLLWPRFARRFETLHRCVVTNERDESWEIRVLRPR
jgi:SAM-dependent methyltransferase